MMEGETEDETYSKDSGEFMTQTLWKAIDPFLEQYFKMHKKTYRGW